MCVSGWDGAPSSLSSPRGQYTFMLVASPRTLSCFLLFFLKFLIVTFTSAEPLQVLIEATVSRERRGYIAVDDIMVLNYPCYKAPHFSRLGDEEVNAGQNASFQCVAAGRASEAERFLLEVSAGGESWSNMRVC
ncbi:Receptor-type tyrosine-protein phosphatase U [Takifugu flavidus]|uniref:Receptor-type tyrosine-protein phosphatase U n=1 Tax=Takifugu flavidus TaxID=433684 RepID=A0A5C6PHZ8_9TELE|nr:Receptor-type tyrosine-protein phosphatase U [Takifugu flavidus]